MATPLGRWSLVGFGPLAGVLAAALLFAGCDGGSDGSKAKPTISSVEGNGATPDRIRSAIIVRGAHFKDGDTVEVRDSTGAPITSGVRTTTLVDATQLRLGVSPAAFPVNSDCTVVVKRSGKVAATAPSATTFLQGPAGPAGAQGPKGDTGDTGAAGADGADGAPGADGVPGADGADGSNGADGATGPKGDKGDKGDAGDPAPTYNAGAGIVIDNDLHTITLANPVAVDKGGTGAATLTGFLLGNGTSAVTAVKAKLDGTLAPAATDDASSGYAVGSRWVDTVAKKEYVCVDPTATAAVWKETTATSGNVTSVTATAPLTSSGGATPDIKFGTAIAPTTADANADVIWGPTAQSKKGLGLQARPLIAAPAAVNVSNKQLTGTTATITTAAPHGLSVGAVVTVAVAPADTHLNGTYAVVSVPTTTTFTYARTVYIKTKALTTNVATLTTNGNHGFLVGDSVTVAIAAPGDVVFDGTYVITAKTATTFSYARVNADVAATFATGTASVDVASAATGGTITAGATLTANMFEIQKSDGTPLFAINLGAASGSATTSTSIGVGAGLNLTSGADNTFVGNGAGAMVTSSGYNVAVGRQALNCNVSNGVNTAVGHQALRDQTDSNTTAVGAGALKYTTNSYYSVAVGANAMEGFLGLSSGDRNVAVGGTALRRCTGSNNTALGNGAGMGNTMTGSYNVFVGDVAGSGATTGGYNTFVGPSAGSSTTTGTGNVILGASAAASSATASNEFVAGSSTYALNNVYFGKGATSAAPTAYTIQGTGSSGAAAGGDLQMAGGTSSTGTGGAIAFQTAFPTSTTLTTKVKINPAGITSLYMGASVADAATIVPTGNLFHVTGTGTVVTTIDATGLTAGTTITIIFDSVVQLTGGNMKLAGGTFISAPHSTLTLVWDGTFWYEIARSVNN